MDKRKNIWLLNFEHDLALASGMPFYMPPKVAVSMNEDMSPLPFWLSGNTTVLTQQLTTQQAIAPETLALMEQLGIDGSLRRTSTFETQGDETFNVWGWDPQSAQQLRKFGFEYPEDLEHIKTWSHRCKTIDFLKQFAANGLFPANLLPRKATKLKEIESWTQAEKLILKAPLSGSGRGIWWALNGFDFNVQRWSNRTISTQGCVLCEPIWEKTGDFAMEFRCGAGKAQFAGYSHFMADNAGVYRCNLLESNEATEALLADKVGTATVLRVKALWEELLTNTIAPHYNGIVGIDMLTGTVDGVERLNPCVEINLRMTMGMAARLIYDQWIAPGSVGEYRTIHFKQDGELKSHAAEQRSLHPVELTNGKISKGYALLTAETDNTHYGVEIEVRTN
ncbi:MAG: hypothetical protein MJZ02_04985 [Paludibacteraceae bacterium]|nr:hypothetical protein [Paludibacteraceae bacterium]